MQVFADRFLQHADQDAVDEIERVDDEQRAQHIGPVRLRAKARIGRRSDAHAFPRRGLVPRFGATLRRARLLQPDYVQRNLKQT